MGVKKSKLYPRNTVAFSGSVSGRGLKSAVASTTFLAGVSCGCFGSQSSGDTRNPSQVVIRSVYGTFKTPLSLIAWDFLPLAYFAININSAQWAEPSEIHRHYLKLLQN